MEKYHSLRLQTQELYQSGRLPAQAHGELLVWVGLRQWYGADAKPRPLPECGGWMDQDAALMWALHIIDQAWAQEDRLEQVRRTLDISQVPTTGGLQLPANPTFA